MTMAMANASQRLVFSGLLLLVFVDAVAMAFGFSASVRMAPLVIGVPTLALICVQFYRDVVGMRAVRRAGPGEYQSATKSSLGSHTSDPTNTGGQVREPIVFAWIALLAVAVLLLGLLLGSMVFLAGFLWLHGRERWYVVLAWLVFTYLTFQVLFVEVLRYSLHEGSVRVPYF